MGAQRYNRFETFLRNPKLHACRVCKKYFNFAVLLPYMDIVTSECMVFEIILFTIG